MSSTALSFKPERPALLGALALCCLSSLPHATQAEVRNSEYCYGDGVTLYGSTDAGAYTAFSNTANVVQMDCHANMAAGTRARAGTDGSVNNIAIGSGSEAIGQQASTFGVRSAATAREATAIGNNATSSAQQATALGTFSTSSGFQSLAAGYKAQASGSNAVAIGANSVASGDNEVSFGNGAFRRNLVGIDNLWASGQASVQGIVNGGVGIQQAGLITGVREGAVHAQSDEAVTGAQLYGVQSDVNWALSQTQSLRAAHNVTAATVVQIGDRVGSHTNQLAAHGAQLATVEGTAGQALTLAMQNGQQIQQVGATTVQLGDQVTRHAATLADHAEQLAQGQRLQALQAAVTTEHAARLQQHSGQIAQLAGQVDVQGAVLASHQAAVDALLRGEQGTCTVAAGGAMQCSAPGQAGSSAEGVGAVALGVDAQARGDGTQAIGHGARALFAGSVAIGTGAPALADPTTALGYQAVASGNNAVALGANTWAAGDNAVALGQGSYADRPDSVSVGDVRTGYRRQMVNVADGTAPTDAVNVAQMQRSIAQAADAVRRFAARGVAQAMAIPATPVLAPGKRWIGAAMGHYAGQSALGVGFAYQATERWNLGAAVSVSAGSGSHVGVRLQSGYQW